MTSLQASGKQTQVAGRLRAVLYLREGDEYERWTAHGLDWCTAAGYELTSLVSDPDGSRWPVVFELLVAGMADVVVVGQRHHIPKTTPRIEVIAEERQRLAPAALNNRRPTLLDRARDESMLPSPGGFSPRTVVGTETRRPRFLRGRP